MSEAFSALLDWLRARFARSAPRVTPERMDDYLAHCDAVGWPT